MKKYVFSEMFIVSIALILCSCTSKIEKNQIKKDLKRNKSASQLYNSYIVPEKENYDLKIKDFISGLTLEDKISQLFIINLEGNTKFRSYETCDLITGKKEDSKKPLVAGGYLFFSYNICETPQLQKNFIQTINSYCDENNIIRPFLAVDQEGGWVNRLKKLTGGLPSQKDVAEKNTVYQAYEIYSNQAAKMKDMGFTMNLAPVVEICTPDNQEFLDGRSFGDLEKTCSYGAVCIKAYENNGIATVIKHFPGNTNTDPHVGLPVIKLSEKELDDSIESFKKLIEYKPASILMSHAITTAVDNGVPSCLSKVWVTEKLREEYGFEGIIFSDDIFMGALKANGYPPEKAAVLALEAGIDCIMISEKRFSKPAKIIYNKAKEDKSFEEKINRAAERIIKYKINNNILEI